MTRKRFYGLVVGLPLMVFLTAAGCIHTNKAKRFGAYEPQTGDVVMQSLPNFELVRAIEGVTGSPFSHCGIVVRKDNKWLVLEAIGPVKYTTLSRYLDRGRADAFAVYRLRPQHQVHVPAMIAAAEEKLDLPYDFRYRMEDDEIYCSELIYKAFQSASGEQLGTLETLGSLNWQPYADTIRKYEGGDVPQDRPMITPVGLSRAPQLELKLLVGYEDN